MPTYKIGLSRTYLITIQAKTPEIAKKLSELFISELDTSIPTDRSEYGFLIEKIDLVENEVFQSDNVQD